MTITGANNTIECRCCKSKAYEVQIGLFETKKFIKHEEDCRLIPEYKNFSCGICYGTRVNKTYNRPCHNDLIHNMENFSAQCLIDGDLFEVGELEDRF